MGLKGGIELIKQLLAAWAPQVLARRALGFGLQGWTVAEVQSAGRESVREGARERR